MKHTILISLLIAAVPALAQLGQDPAKNFVEEHFSKGKQPPFALMYGGKSSSSFISEWKYSEQTRKLDGDRTERSCTYTDPSTGLVIRSVCTTFSDFPAVEWVVTQKNTGKVNSPLLEDIEALDADLAFAAPGNFILHRAKGSAAERSDFAPIDAVLGVGTDIAFGPVAGRSSDNTAFPFYNIEGPGGGVMVGIGWSGRWKADVKRSSAETVHLTAGMERTHLVLYPGEEIRTPRILLLFWQGDDRMTGHNLLRKFILKHHTLQKGGKPVTLPLAAAIAFGGPSPCNEYSCATETYAIAMAYRLSQFGLSPEIGWIDAGWFEGAQEGWWRGVGNWFVNKKNFPNGLRPVSVALEKNGMGFLLWFEPERVFEGTWLDREHPEWLIKLPQNPNRLLNLGNKDARRWLTDHISGMLEKERISIYRQDFNFDPMPYWQANDSPERIGMTEIRHTEGLYAYWDELLARHPGLLIDNCASGGRRIDLETVSRSSPFWRTDYSYFEPNGYQCHTYGINFYLPCSGTGNNNPDAYTFRSSMGSSLVFGWDINQATFPLVQAKRSIEEYKRLRPYFYGDYYPLTDYSTSDEAWMAYQFARPDVRDGIVLAFRRVASMAQTINIKLHGLEPEATYDVTYEDYGITVSETGKKLSGGVDIKIPVAPGSLLVTYHVHEKD